MKIPKYKMIVKLMDFECIPSTCYLDIMISKSIINKFSIRYNKYFLSLKKYINRKFKDKEIKYQINYVVKNESISRFLSNYFKK